MSLIRTWYNTLVNDSGATIPDGTVVDKNFIDAILDEVDAALGLWTDIAYLAGNFLGSGAMVWTVDAGDVLFNRFKVVDKQITWHVQLATTTIGGTVDTTLRIKAPAGVTFPSFSEFVPVALPAAAYVQPVASNELGVRLLAGNWALGTNAHYIYFTFIGQVN